jgi:matrixin
MLLFYSIIPLIGVSLVAVYSCSIAPLIAAEASTINDNDEEDDDEDFEEKDSIQICCAWGRNLEDGILTYYIDDDYSSEEQQQAVREAIQEWDTKIEPLKIEEDSNKETSDISIEFQDDHNDGEEIAGQTITISDASGFLINAQITIFQSVQEYEFETTTIGQVAKHEMGHALGLGHANFDGNLMAEMVNDGTATVSECEINAVIKANHWKLGDNSDGDAKPRYPQDDGITC